VLAVSIENMRPYRTREDDLRDREPIPSEEHVHFHEHDGQERHAHSHDHKTDGLALDHPHSHLTNPDIRHIEAPKGFFDL
jgi:hypothetical protein